MIRNKAALAHLSKHSSRADVRPARCLSSARRTDSTEVSCVQSYRCLRTLFQTSCCPKYSSETPSSSRTSTLTHPYSEVSQPSSYLMNLNVILTQHSAVDRFRVKLTCAASLALFFAEPRFLEFLRRHDLVVFENSRDVFEAPQRLFFQVNDSQVSSHQCFDKQHLETLVKTGFEMEKGVDVERRVLLQKS